MININTDNYYIDKTYDEDNNIETISYRPKLSQEEYDKRKRQVEEELFNILHKYKFDN